MATAIRKAPVARVVWKLRQVMADRRISNVALANELGVHQTSISRLRTKDDLPAIGGEEVERIRKAIQRLSDRECLLSELIVLQESPRTSKGEGR